MSKSMFVYIYTSGGVVNKVMFRFRKGKVSWKDDPPRDSLKLSKDGGKMPKDVIIQVRFEPLEFNLYEG